MWPDRPSPLESHKLLAAPPSHGGHNTEQHEGTDDTETDEGTQEITEKGTKGLSNMGCGTHLSSFFGKS